ncbi:histidine kinase [bacterium 336/3]|nr:histidine kinase [bacterium 336/3]
MKIKTKLNLGVGLLFLLIILLGIVGVKYIHELKEDTKNILVANHNTLEYSKNMLIALDEKKLIDFEKNLQKQEKNITEVGEYQATRRLRQYFNQYKAQKPNQEEYIRKEIFQIMEMNMQAIEKKGKFAQNTANTATFWVVGTATLCFLIAFTLLINLPSHIANPIQELSESIKQIASKNYSQRVYFGNHDEFGDLATSFNTMAQKLEEYNHSNVATLMMEKKRIEALINTMHDPVIGLDENYCILFINQEASKIIGIPEKDILGKSAQEVAIYNDLIRSLLQSFTQKKEEKNIKIYLDGKENYFEKDILDITIIPTGEKIEKIVGYVLILRNVTTYKELDIAKTNFIATVSHEFKTPISSMKMSLQLLENEKIGYLNEEQKNLLHSIDEDTQRLLKITAELLHITQVESGNIQLNIAQANLSEIIAYAIDATKIQAEQKNITLEVDMPTSIPSPLVDSEKTAWVLTNLISNAIRYSYENTKVYLKTTIEKEYLKITVQDTGQGIAHQYKEKIFERYFRVPNTKKEGTGLGLAISKEFIEAQGGYIEVVSELGEGSSFMVYLKYN